jgi:hypothetical protein
VVSLSRAWTVALAVAVLAAAAASTYAAWRYRRLVGFDSGWTCTLDPAWRIHLAWWLVTAIALMLFGSAVALLQAVTGRGEGRAGLPLLVCVVAVAAIWCVDVFAFGGWNDAGCSTPATPFM